MKWVGRVMEWRFNICFHGRRVARPALRRAFAREMWSKFVPLCDEVGIVPYVVIFRRVEVPLLSLSLSTVMEFGPARREK